MANDVQHGAPQLPQDEEELRRIVDLIPQTILILNPEGKVIYANRVMREYTGLSLDELRGDDFRNRVIHPEDLERVREQRQEALAHPIPFENEQRTLGKDGIYRWFLIVYNPLLDEQGRLIRWYVAGTDINDSKQAKEALQASELKLRQDEEELRQIVDLIPQYIVVLDSGGRATFVNQQVLDYTGLSRDEVQAVDFRERAFHPEDVERLREERRNALAGSVPFHNEQRILGRDGNYRWFLIRYNPLLDENRKAVRWYATATEITELKQAQEKLWQVIDTIPTLAWCMLPDGTNEFLHRKWHEYTGLSPEESRGWGWQATFHPEDLPPLMEKWKGMLVSGEPGGIEARLRRHDGIYRWFLIRAEPFRDEAGKIVRWYGTSTDIDDRKKVEEALQSKERNLRLIINTIPALAWSARPDGSLDFVNRPWLDYTGFSAEQGRNWGWIAAFHPDDLNRVVNYWRSILATGEPGEIEARVRRFDGEYRWFLIRASALRNESGTIVKWYGTNTDIEDRKQAERKLREEEQQLREITDAIHEIIIVLAPDGRTLYVNQVGLDATGFTLADAIEKGLFAGALHPEDLDRLRGKRQERLSGGAPFQLEARAFRGGQYRWQLLQYNPLKDEQGQVIRWYCTATDIDDRRKMEEQLRNENIALREEIDRSSMFEEIVGSCKPMRQVLKQVEKVAASDSTVLILGETGTGKELIARALHRRSKRANRAFIRVNCAAIPQSLIASELFGHEKGAFTGALQRRPGRFEAADGGTLFLDEIGDLPMETQITLLRVLQEREFERVGSNHPISVDVRLIAATNRDLPAAVAAGTFRQDLFYRLNVFPIAVPPLREREEDIPLLVEYFVGRYAYAARKKIRHIGAQTLEQLTGYHWPGNIRELQNVVERAVILCETDTFMVDESWLRRESADSPRPREGLSALADREVEMIEAALAESHGRISGPSGAAAKLGIPRQTLESKMRRLGIDRYGQKRPATK